MKRISHTIVLMLNLIKVGWSDQLKLMWKLCYKITAKALLTMMWFVRSGRMRKCGRTFAAWSDNMVRGEAL
jgi:hypothetical protein